LLFLSAAAALIQKGALGLIAVIFLITVRVAKDGAVVESLPAAFRHRGGACGSPCELSPHSAHPRRHVDAGSVTRRSTLGLGCGSRPCSPHCFWGKRRELGASS